MYIYIYNYILIFGNDSNKKTIIYHVNLNIINIVIIIIMRLLSKHINIIIILMVMKIMLK